MFATCCKETTIKNEEYYFYKGYGNQNQKRIPVRQSQVNPMVEETIEPFRLYLRSQEEEVVRQLGERSQMFNDKEFKHGDQALGHFTGRPVQWVRLSTLCEHVQISEFSPMDLLSLKGGDSYFLASLLALYSNIPLIRDIFSEQLQVSQIGAYKLRVNIRGKPQELVIDDYLPVFSNNRQRTVFSHLEPSMIWAAILEKGYAKIQGSYEAINMGFAHQVFVTFSLAPSIYQLIPTDFRQEQQQRCWKTIVEAYELNFPIVFGSRMKHTCSSILPNQTYCLKNCKIIQKNRKVQKRITIWQLPRTKPQQIDPFVEYQKSGNSLSLPLVEFMRNFQIIDVSHYRNNFNSHFYQFKCGPNNPSMYTFTITENSNVYLTLQRESGESGRLRLILINCQSETNFLFVGGRKEQIYSDVTLRLDELPVGNYLVLCESSSLSNCILRVYALMNLPLKKLTGNKIILLQQTFLQLSSSLKEDQHALSKEHDDWYTSRALFSNLSMGYFTINLDEQSEIRCQIEINLKELRCEGLNLINKSKEGDYYCLVEKGQKQILIFEYVGEELQAFTFPPHCMKIKMII